jgi:membrane fusion protein, multidrug efflux system
MRSLITVAVISIFITACGTKANNLKPTNKSQAIPVKLAPINSDSNTSAIHVSGVLSTEEEAKLSFKMGGVIESITVKEGGPVKKGQLLATLKSTEIDAQVAQAQLALQKAQRDYQRASNLYKDSVATLEQFQNAKTGVDVAQRTLQQVSFNHQYSKIYAVADGFIVKKILNEGEVVSSGTAVLHMSAVSPSSKWILRAGVADREWAAIEMGNEATVTIDAFPGKKFPAHVSSKSLSADANSGSFEIEMKIDFKNEQPALGMFGKASIVPSKTTTGFSIPYEALLEANGKTAYVFVTDDQKTVKRIPVTIESIDNNKVYISDGLQGYQHIVVSGSAYLNEKSHIAVSK